MSRLLYHKRFFQRIVVVAIIFGLAFIISLFVAHAAQKEDNMIRLRIVAYNVACGQWTTPEQVAEVLKPLEPNIVFLNEVPKANLGKKVKDWSSRVAENLGLNHVYVGISSSANHKAPRWGDLSGDYGGKFKSVLSSTPLTGGRDYILKGMGWSPAGVVRVETKIGDRKFALYSLHIPGKAINWQDSKHMRLADIIAKEDPSFDIIIGGDFNKNTDDNIMQTLLSTCNLKNVIPSASLDYIRYCSNNGLRMALIDHILYSAVTPVKVLQTKVDWGPKKETKGYLSDHPWVFCELEIPAHSNSKK